MYIKNTQGSFDFYEYTIKESFEIGIYDTNHLKETPGKYELTTYGCYEIGDNGSRWKNTAELTNKKLAHSDLRLHAAAPEIVSLEKETTTIALPATNTKDTRQTTIQTLSKPATTKTSASSSASSKTSSIYTVLKTRNQYVIADTLPASAIREHLAARIQKKTASKTSFMPEDQMTTLFKVIVAKASKDKELAMKIVAKLKVLVDKLEGIEGKEPQLAFMQKLYEALQPYVTKTTSKKTTTTKTPEIPVSTAGDGKVIVLEDGTRFIPK